MARKTVRVSDISVQEIPEGKGTLSASLSRMHAAARGSSTSPTPREGNLVADRSPAADESRRPVSRRTGTPGR